MSGINNCTFTGRLVKTPELRTVREDKVVCSFSIAVESGYGDNKRVAYPSCFAWGSIARLVSTLDKGTMLGVESEMRESSYTDKNGVKRRAIEYYVNNIHILSPKKKETENVMEAEPYIPEFEEV